MYPLASPWRRSSQLATMGEAKRKRDEEASAEPTPVPTEFTIDFPILDSNISVGTLGIEDKGETWGVVEVSDILGSKRVTLDRGQVGDLWRALREVEKKMPRTRKQVARPDEAPSEAVRPSGLVIAQ